MEERTLIARNSPSRVWEMVCALKAENRMPPRKPEYAQVREGLYFLRRYDAAFTTNDHTVLEHDYPDLYAAHEIYADLSGERWILEAGLLTDLTLGELADYVSQPESVVGKYEAVFYNIRPRLKSRGYVLNHICMPAVRRGMHGRDYDFCFKTIAYCLGWQVFTEFIDGRNMSDGSRNALEQSFRDRLVKLGWLAANRLEVNNFNGVEVIEQCLKLQELEKSRGPAVGQAEAYVVLQTLLTNCRTTILPADKELCLDEPRVTDAMVGAEVEKYVEPVEVKP